jgi:porin
MQKLTGKLVYVMWAALCLFVARAYSQETQEETLGGPDSHETGQGPHGHLFGEWGGERTRLQERGVRFDFQCISDSLWNIKSDQKERLASWNRFRGTVGIDFGALAGRQGLYFHATALWQGGGNLGTYLGLLTGPSGMASANTCRLDSWWIEKRWRNQRISARAGQFAGQDFYAAQHYAASFIFEPIGYAFGNLFTTLESFDPPSTPAMEVRVVPKHNFYVKSMVLAGVRSPFSQNPTGLVPQFNGTPVSVSEIGFTPGKRRRPCEPSTPSTAATDTPASISSAPPTTPKSSRHRRARHHDRGTTSCTGWRARLCGEWTRTKQEVWMRRWRTTGAQRTSTATTRCSRRGYASTSPCR